LEYDILQNIEHPNVVKIDGIFEESDKIFIVLEYICHGDFYDFIKNNCKYYLR
jgi:aurora kinase